MNTIQWLRLPMSMMLVASCCAVLAQDSAPPLSKYIKNYDDGKRSSANKPDVASTDESDGVKLTKKEASFPIHEDHIFNGGINRSDHLVGCHHKPSAPKQMRVDGKMCDVEIKQTSPGTDKDVVTAKVILTDPNSGKIVREKFSTLFPAAWTKAEIERAIREAYAYAKAHGDVERDGAFHGKARDIKIDGYLTNDGDAIATAYPIYNAPQKKSNKKKTNRE